MARRKKLDENQSTENTENTDDTFGLPEIEYEPLKREETQTTETTSETVSYETETTEIPEREEVFQEEVRNEYTTTTYEEDEPSSPLPKIIGIVVVLLLLAGGAYWFFGVYQPDQRAKAERVRQEQLASEEAARKAELERVAAQSRLDNEQRVADSLASLQTKDGSIETLTDRTRRYYVVIASAIDGDLIMDHAKELSAKGVSSKIIPPFGKAKFYRLAVADGDTYPDTQSTADGLKGEYGGAVWVVRY